MSKKNRFRIWWPVIAAGFFLIGKEMGRPYERTDREISFRQGVVKQVERDCLHLLVPDYFCSRAEEDIAFTTYLYHWLPGMCYEAEEALRKGITVAEYLGENEPELMDRMALENRQFVQVQEEMTGEGSAEGEHSNIESEDYEAEPTKLTEDPADHSDNDTVPTSGEGIPTFVPHERVQTLDGTVLADYNKLLSRFYTVDGVTKTDRTLLDYEKLSSADMTIDKDTQGPQILIYHTHSQEAFADSVSGDSTTSIVGVGDHLTQILESQYGYRVLHHTGEYDKETRNNAYTRALPEILKILEENPDIQVVIDLHRDAMEENNRLVVDLDGRKTAKFMFFNGISRTAAGGDIAYLANPYLADNLAFSYQMKQKAEEYYPGLTRRNYINAYRYNMHLCPKTLLIELGAQNNTLEEALNACDPLAHILDMVLTGK